MLAESLSVTVGALAKAAGVSEETVRYYQRRGLFATPPKGGHGFRRYGPEALKKIAQIDEQIAALQALRTALSNLTRKCEKGAADLSCPILEAIRSADAAARRRVAARSSRTVSPVAALNAVSVSGTSIINGELESEAPRLISSFDIRVPGTTLIVEIWVDAGTLAPSASNQQMRQPKAQQEAKGGKRRGYKERSTGERGDIKEKTTSRRTDCNAKARRSSLLPQFPPLRISGLAGNPISQHRREDACTCRNRSDDCQHQREIRSPRHESQCCGKRREGRCDNPAG